MPRGPAETARVLRGGAFNDLRCYVRCADRGRSYYPVYRGGSIGFRVVAPGL